MKFDSMIASDHTYALFFDIDGTLVSFKTHEIPLSTTSVDDDGILHALKHFHVIQP